MSPDANQFQANQDVIFKAATKIYRLDQSIMTRLTKQKATRSLKEVVAISVISESHDYLKACIYAVKGAHLRSAGSLLRSLLESSANIFWILQDKSDKRAGKYLDTIKTLSDHMDSALGKMQEPNQRIPLEVSRWTTSSAEDRLKAFSPLALMIWDYCSLFTHAQPSLIQYLLRSNSGQVPLFLAGQAVIYALTTRLIIAEETKLLTEKERDRILEITNKVIPYLV